jgi:hypothetical protein
MSKFILIIYLTIKEGKDMKKTIIISGIMLLASFGQAFSRSAGDVVVTDGITYFAEKVIPGTEKIKIYNATGEITKIPSRTVESFIKNGQVFVKLPVVTKTKDTVGTAFMQYITSREGLQLFRYCSNCLHYDPVENSIAPINAVYRYYVFSGGKFFLLLDELNTDSFLSYFGVKVIS